MRILFSTVTRAGIISTHLIINF